MAILNREEAVLIGANAIFAAETTPNDRTRDPATVLAELIYASGFDLKATYKLEAIEAGRVAIQEAVTDEEIDIEDKFKFAIYIAGAAYDAMFIAVVDPDREYALRLIKEARKTDWSIAEEDEDLPLEVKLADALERALATIEAQKPSF